MRHMLRHGLNVLSAMVRHLLWALMCGLVAAGSGWCGRPDVYAAWREVGLPARRHPTEDESATRRYATRGIAEIEAFLAGHGSPRGLTDRPSGGNSVQQSPPTLGEP